jgi:hypothetical protein
MVPAIYFGDVWFGAVVVTGIVTLIVVVGLFFRIWERINERR